MNCIAVALMQQTVRDVWQRLYQQHPYHMHVTPVNEHFVSLIRWYLLLWISWAHDERQQYLLNLILMNHVTRSELVDLLEVVLHIFHIFEKKNLSEPRNFWPKILLFMLYSFSFFHFSWYRHGPHRPPNSAKIQFYILFGGMELLVWGHA